MESAPGVIAASDGTRLRTRTYDPEVIRELQGPGGDRLSSNFKNRAVICEISNQLSRANISLDPIYTAFRTALLSPDGRIEWLWLCQALRRIKPKTIHLSNGNLQLKWEESAPGISRNTTVELDPKRGHLIVQKDEQQSNWSRQIGTSSWQRTRVAESQDMGGWYLPTVVVMEQLNSTDSVIAINEIRLSDLRTDFSEDLFTNVFQPGDLVREGRAFYKVLADGSLQESEAPPSDEEPGKATQKQYFTMVGAVCAAIVAIYFAVAGYKKMRVRKSN